MGWSRWSNLVDLLSFHLRKTVHKTAKPPTEAATTIRTVMSVVLPVEDRPELGALMLFCAVCCESTEVDVCVTVEVTDEGRAWVSDELVLLDVWLVSDVCEAVEDEVVLDSVVLVAAAEVLVWDVWDVWDRLVVDEFVAVSVERDDVDVAVELPSISDGSKPAPITAPPRFESEFGTAVLDGSGNRARFLTKRFRVACSRRRLTPPET